MLGVYENFPENIHKLTDFVISTSTKRFQQTLIQLLNEANNKTFDLEDVTEPAIPQCTVTLEFGIAEANNFNYLDKEETNKILRAIYKKILQTIDFYCVLKYYKTQKDKKIPLRFDYYMIRFTFNKNLVRMQIFHERGPRYTSPEDITKFVFNGINRIFSRKMLKKV